MEEVEEEEEDESPPPAPQALRLRLKRRHISWTSQRVLTSVAMGYAEMTLGMRGASLGKSFFKAIEQIDVYVVF